MSFLDRSRYTRVIVNRVLNVSSLSTRYHLRLLIPVYTVLDSGISDMYSCHIAMQALKS